jgi:hypothetical protein
VRQVPARANFAGTSVIRLPIRSLDRPVSTPEAKHGSSNQRNRSGSVSPIRPRIRLRFGGVNSPIET